MDNVSGLLEMPQEAKTTWLEALRSGKYKQSDSFLCKFTDEYGEGCGHPLDDPMPEGFCCLGVLADVLSGREALLSGKCGNEDNSMPTDEWYTANGMGSFFHKHLDLNPTKSTYKSPGGIRADTILTSMNDGYSYQEGGFGSSVKVQPKSFLEIADFIEANVKGV